MRLAFAWVVGIAVALVLLWGGEALLSAIGVPSWISLEHSLTIGGGGGRTRYEEDVYGFRSTPGYVVAILAVMLGARAGMWVATGEPGGGLTPAARFQFTAWLVGLAAVGVVGCLARLVLGSGGRSDVIATTAEVVTAAAAILWAARQFRIARAKVRG